MADIIYTCPIFFVTSQIPSHFFVKLPKREGVNFTIQFWARPARTETKSASPCVRERVCVSVYANTIDIANGDRECVCVCLCQYPNCGCCSWLYPHRLLRSKQDVTNKNGHNVHCNGTATICNRQVTKSHG